MDFSKLVLIFLGIYGLGLCGYFSGFVWGFITLELLGKYLVRLGWVIHSLALMVFYLDPGNIYLPWVGLSGVFLCLSWLVATFHVFSEVRSEIRGTALLILPFALASGLFAWDSLSYFPSLAQYQISPLYHQSWFFGRALADILALTVVVLSSAYAFVMLIKSEAKSDTLLLPFALFAMAFVPLLAGGESTSKWTHLAFLASIGFAASLLISSLGASFFNSDTSLRWNAGFLGDRKEQVHPLFLLSRLLFLASFLLALALTGLKLSASGWKDSFHTFLLAGVLGFFCMVAWGMLRKRGRMRNKLPELERIDYFFSRWSLWASPLLFLALLCGAVWNWLNFGHYWSGDGREILLAILFLVFLLLMVLRSSVNEKKNLALHSLFPLFCLVQIALLSAFLWPESLTIP